MTRISSMTGGFSGYASVSRSFADSGGQDPNEYNGSTMVFAQTTAPVGWTKDTTYDDYTLRLVSGTVSTGGTQNFSSVFTSHPISGSVSGITGTVGATTLNISQIASHTHSYTSGTDRLGIIGSGTNFPTRLVRSTDTNPGGSATHDHPFPTTTTFNGTPLNMSIKYKDFILATK